MQFNAFNARKKMPVFRIGLVKEPGTFKVGENVLTAEIGDVLILGPGDVPIDKVDDPAGWKAAHELEILIPPSPATDNTKPAPKSKKTKGGKKK